MRALSMHLMSQCQVGDSGKGKRKQSSPTPQVSKEGCADAHLEKLKGQRLHCESLKCSNRHTKNSNGKVTSRGRKVGTACRCSACQDVGGVVMCDECYRDQDKHTPAFQAARAKHGRRTNLKWY